VARDRSIEKIYGENDELYEENEQLYDELKAK
jgi:hypothetical protein